MKREIRASAVAGQAGVGAVVEVGRESFVVPSTGLWAQKQLRPVDLPRLSARLRKILKRPSSEAPTLEVRRFPRAMFCEKCRRLVMWKVEMERVGQEPSCVHEGCDGPLVPMRFVSACENGHLEDVNWWRWAHSGPNSRSGCRSYQSLFFRVHSGSGAAGLGSLKVECACGSWRSLEEIAAKHAVRQVFPVCGGRHPWSSSNAEQCSADVVVLQRGATNLHYPVTISALDIPSLQRQSAISEFAGQVREHKKYKTLVDLLRSTSGANGDLIDMTAEFVGDAVGCEKQTVLEIATADSEGRAVPESGGGEFVPSSFDLSQEVLLEEEWRTLSGALEAGGMSGENFVAVAEELSGSASPWVRRLVSGVLLLRKLREVRAYLGYQRVRPEDRERTVPPDVGFAENWIPAAEVYGEGFLLALNFDAISAWSGQLPAREQSAISALERRRVEENYRFLPPVDPAYVALHTLSHLLLRQVTFDCGYSSSALRERIYYSREHQYAGIMIYTADGDSEGSLGGLVRQGRSDRLAAAMAEAADQGAWCSSDPVCTETAGQGLGGFNHAACHACALVSETSCVNSNTLLDRRLLFDGAWGLRTFLEERR